mgnify:CR=1 FL=1
MFAAGVDEMQEHAAALDMAEEAVADADAFVRAWGKGESGAWTYTSDAVELTFGSTNPSGGPRWSRTSSGTTTVTYGNRDGGTLVLTLDLERVGSGSAGAITGAALS